MRKILALLITAVLLIAACSTSSDESSTGTDGTTDGTDSAALASALDTLVANLAVMRFFSELEALLDTSYLDNGQTPGTDNNYLEMTFPSGSVMPTPLTLGTPATVTAGGADQGFSFTLPSPTLITISTTSPWRYWEIYDGATMKIMYAIEDFQYMDANPSVTWDLPAGSYYILFYDLTNAGADFMVTAATAAAGTAETLLFPNARNPVSEAVSGQTDKYWVGIQVDDQSGSLNLDAPLSYIYPSQILFDSTAAAGSQITVIGNGYQTGAEIEIEDITFRTWNGSLFPAATITDRDVYIEGIEGFNLMGDASLVTLTTTGNYAIGDNSGGSCSVGSLPLSSVNLSWSISNSYYQFTGNDCVGLVQGSGDYNGTISWTISGDSGLLPATSDTQTVTIPAIPDFLDISGITVNDPVFSGPQTFTMMWSGISQPTTQLAARAAFIEEFVFRAYPNNP